MKKLEDIRISDIVVALRDVRLAKTNHDEAYIRKGDILVCVETGVYANATITNYKLRILLHPEAGLLQIAYLTTLSESPWGDTFEFADCVNSIS